MIWRFADSPRASYSMVQKKLVQTQSSLFMHATLAMSFNKQQVVGKEYAFRSGTCCSSCIAYSISMNKRLCIPCIASTTDIAAFKHDIHVGALSAGQEGV